MRKLDTKRALTIAEAARYACVSRNTLELWLSENLLPFEELPGRGKGTYKFRRIRLLDLNTFLDQHYYRQQELSTKKKPIKSRLILLPRKKDTALEKRA